MSSQRVRRDTGAAAVEFALVVPVLFVLIFGIIDFGRAYQAKVELAHAAREGVRTYSLTRSGSEAATRARQAATSLEKTTTAAFEVGVTAAGCTGTSDFGDAATVTTSYSFSYLTPLPALVATLPGAGALAGPITLEEDGVMRCGG